MVFVEALLIAHGHSPEALDDLSWRQIDAFITVLPYLSHPRYGGGF